MKIQNRPARSWTGSIAGILLLLLVGCRTYTGVEKVEFLEESVVDESVVVDDLAMKALHLPDPGKAQLEIHVRWDFRREYYMQKTFKVFREYYPYNPAMELLEVVSAPFMFLTVFPTALLTAPFELLGGAGGKESGDYLFTKMLALPFMFLNPGGNADTWVGQENVYGKKPELEDAGTRTDPKGPLIVDEKHEDAAGAKLAVRVVETDQTFEIQADEKGKASLPIAVEMAEISQEGKGLTFEVTALYQDKESEETFEVDAETLETIYEALKLE
ncbi:MAG: hypothetical protein ACYS47_07890 [Planctomycetota bacterium]|jgi:hypothetical protein